MSTRDDQPATVPPPDGEDDAYSATTKVGAMPADIMEKLRAEGLLPDEVEQDEKAKAAEREKRIVSIRPATSAAEPMVPPPSSGRPVPQLYSMPPSAADGEEEEGTVMMPSKLDTAKPPAPPVVESIETPVAFAFPPASQLPRIAEPVAAEPRPETSAAAEKTAAKGPSKAVMALVAVAVVVLLIVALIRLRG